MKIMIHTDLEGAARVFSFAQCLDNANPEKRVAMRFLTAEVNACVDGILDEDPAAEIVVRDGHGPGGIDFETLTDKASLISGKGKGGVGFDSSYDAMFIVGQHSMEGTKGGNLCHTYSPDEIESWRLNGAFIGEFHIHAYQAGTVHGVPVALLSGDEAAVAEAKALIPGIVGVAVKKGFGRESAQSKSPGEARKLIRAGAAEAVRRVRAKKIPPVRIEPPYMLEIRSFEGKEACLETYLKRGGERVDSRTVVIRSADPKAILRGSPSATFAPPGGA